MKTIVLTGGGRGLGRVTAAALARLGHRVIFTARDARSGASALAELRAEVPGAAVEMRVADLASLASVRACGDALVADGTTVDVLFHIAGVMQQSATRRVTVDGFEETLAVNALAPFVLTRHALPALERSAAARVVNVTSRLHLPGSRGAPVDFDFDDPQLERGYHPDRAYKNSKLAVLWFTYELQRRLPPRPITANAVCPGFVPVTAAASTRGAMRFFLRHVLAHMPFARTVDEACRSFVFMALDPALEGTGGRFYGEMRPLESSPESRDAARAARFWDYAAAATGTGPWPA